MRIRYVGIGIRIIEPFVWNKENDYIVDVPDIEQAAELLTYPGEQFQAVDEGDLDQIVSFVEGDPRPADESKERKKTKSEKRSEP